MTQYNILIVEDDSSLRTVVCDILEMNQFRTYQTENGREALATLEWLRADLIVSDIMMPEMDGYEFFTQVRARPDWAHIPFIFLTAKGSKPDILAGKKLGADDYLTKPFDAAELLVAISSKLAIAERWKQVQYREISTIKRTILRALTHEFRTPLTYIATYTEILAESGGQLNQSDFEEFCQGILAGSRRLQGLVEDFLFLVQMETGEAQHTFESRRSPIFHWQEFLQGAVNQFRQKAQARGLEINQDVPADLPPVVADLDYLANALGRLVDNAIKFTPAGSNPIALQASSTGKAVHLAVRDHGVGIRPEAIPELFQALHQVDRDKMEQQGAGIGLAIAKSIAVLHGGEIRVESEPGQGSTFTIVLPATKSMPVRTSL